MLLKDVKPEQCSHSNEEHVLMHDAPNWQSQRPHILKPKSVRALTEYEKCKLDCKKKRDQADLQQVVSLLTYLFESSNVSKRTMVTAFRFVLPDGVRKNSLWSYKTCFYILAQSTNKIRDREMSHSSSGHLPHRFKRSTLKRKRQQLGN